MLPAHAAEHLCRVPPSAGAAGTAIIHRQSPWLFLAFAATTLIAFRPAYYSRLGNHPRSIRTPMAWR